jgi:sugar lactone lactonase YvrE
MKRSKLFLGLWLACAVSGPLIGVETVFWQVGTFDEFLEGTLSGVSITKEGELRLAPEAHSVFSPEEALALSLAGDRHHNVYIGTGHQGKVFRLDSNLKGSLFFTAHEPDIFAMAVGPDEALYVASSPEGKIYRVTPDGKSTVFYEPKPKAKYIWALVFDAQGRLYAGTGDRGQILRIGSNGQGEVFFESKQTHIMCLTLDRQGNLVAGSDPNGLIYRITPQGKAFVLYQAGLPEIHELATDSDGRIYAAALGGAGGKGTPELFLVPAQGAGQLQGTTTVTVTGSDEARAAASKAQNPPAAPSTPPSFNRPGPQTFGFPLPAGMQGRGSLIEISPDSTAEAVWNSNNESIFGLALRGRHVVFSTDSNGRVFDLDPSRDGRKLTLLTETHESLATRLLLQGPDLYITTSNVARVFRLGSNPTREGSYESPVKDTKFISQWGTLAWRGEVSADTRLELFSRAGNSDRPDQTWSDWAGPYTHPDGTQILSPPARYIQWKAVLHGSGNATPVLDDVTIAYLNQNLPPQIRSLNVSTGGERTSPSSAPSPPGVSAGGVSVSLGPPTSFSAPPGAGAAPRPPTTLSWQADDPNGDQLIYSLYIKATDEQEWHLLKDKLRQTSYPLEPTSLADGKYVVRLVASDEESNPPALARKAEMVSAPFWIDNTPPEVRMVKQVATPAGLVEVQFHVEDSTSPLRSAEAAIDGKDWKIIYSDDGIVDSRAETFTVKLPQLEPGEHIVTLRAYDTAGNAGVAKAVVRLPAHAAPER